MSVIQVSIILDEAIQWYPWMKQVNILFKIKKTQLCRWFKSTYFWMKQFRDTHGWYKSTYFSKYKKPTMSVIQVSILLDDAIHWYPWVIQVNILIKIKRLQDTIITNLKSINTLTKVQKELNKFFVDKITFTPVLITYFWYFIIRLIFFLILLFESLITKINSWCFLDH